MSATRFAAAARARCLSRGGARRLPRVRRRQTRNAEGAKTLQGPVRQVPAAPPRPGRTPFATVKPDGEDYLVSADLSGFNGLIKAAGVPASYEPATLLYKSFEQDDGKWRIAAGAPSQDRLSAEDATGSRRDRQLTSRAP